MQRKETHSISPIATEHILGKSILVVDDSRAMLQAAEMRLNAAGFHNVRLAHDPREASSMVISRPPDLLLLDIHLGNDEVDGLAFLAKLREDGYKELAVVISADFSAKQAFRAATIGANDFLIKGKYLDIADEVSRILRLHFRHSDGSQKPMNMITELGCFRSYGLTADEAEILEQFVKEHRFPSFNILAKELNLPEDQLEDAMEIIYKKFRVDNLAQLTHRLTLCMLFYAREQ